jgi:hypothetical protein
MDLHGRTTSSAASAEAIDGRLSVNNTEQRIHLNAADRTLATQFGYKPVGYPSNRLSAFDECRSHPPSETPVSPSVCV